MKSSKNDELLTFGGHLEVFRRMLFRIIAVAGAIAMVVFCFKETTWEVLLAPSEWDFYTYCWLESVMQAMCIDFRFEEYHAHLIVLPDVQHLVHTLVRKHVCQLALPHVRGVQNMRIQTR